MPRPVKPYKRKPVRKRKYKSKYSKQARQREKMTDMAVNILAVILVVILLVLILNLTVNKKIRLSASADHIAAMNISYNDFKALKNLSAQYDIDFPQALAYYSAENDFFKSTPVVTDDTFMEESFITNFKKVKSSYKRSDIEPVEDMIDTLLREIVYFPIPTGFAGEHGDDYMYGNSWGAKREYGGDRVHLGTDIVDRENIRGRIPIVSMSDGIIEHIGWNELGGYRIGIRTESNTYYYYAHMSQFAPKLAAGSEIKAGEFLGFMGDTGYSKKEGATGNFIVHLHVGISYDAPFSKDEFWVNPYIFLRNVEENRLNLN